MTLSLGSQYKPGQADLLTGNGPDLVSSFSSSLHPRNGFGLPLSCEGKARSIPGAGRGFGVPGAQGWRVKEPEGTFWLCSQ